MHTITIFIDDRDEAIDVYAACLHHYGLDAVLINDGGNGDTPVEAVTDYVETDPTPPHGTPRLVHVKKLKKPDVISVPCPHCGAATGTFCHSISSGKSWSSYNNGHTARKAARDAAWNARP